MRLERVNFICAVWLPESGGGLRGSTTFLAGENREAHRVGDDVWFSIRGQLFVTPWANVSSCLPDQQGAREWLERAAKEASPAKPSTPAPLRNKPGPKPKLAVVPTNEVDP